MNTHTPFKSAYLRFLQLVSAVAAMPGVEDFDANEKALFNTLSLAWSQGAPLSVRGAINQASLGSPATLHKRLKRLIAKDLIIDELAGNDRRTKYLRPTEKGLIYIEWLSSQITVSIQTA